MNTHYTKTRNEQRKLKAHLNKQGIKATGTRNKTSKGWKLNVGTVTRKKLVTMACSSLKGNLVNVIFN